MRPALPALPALVLLWPEESHAGRSQIQLWPCRFVLRQSRFIIVWAQPCFRAESPAYCFLYAPRPDADKGERSLPLVLLDSTSAFDLIGHAIWIDWLGDRVGIPGPAPEWLFSGFQTLKCLFQPSCALLCSSSMWRPSGVDSWPSPFLPQYVLPWVICSAVKQLDSSAKPHTLKIGAILHNSLAAINNWMPLNVLQLNHDTTELLVIGPDHTSWGFGRCIRPFGWLTSRRPWIVVLCFLTSVWTLSNTSPRLFSHASTVTDQSYIITQRSGMTHSSLHFSPLVCCCLLFTCLNPGWSRSPSVCDFRWIVPFSSPPLRLCILISLSFLTLIG